MRNVGGLALREGRFYTFSVLLLLHDHYGHKVKDEKNMNKDFLLKELEFEWDMIKTLLGKKGDMEALTVLYAFFSKMVYQNKVDMNYNREDLTATSIADRTYKAKRREEFERDMTNKVLIKLEDARGLLRTYAAKKKMSKMDVLLL